MLTLVRRSIGRTGGTCLSIVCVLVAFQLALIAVASSFVASGDFARLSTIVPAVIRNTLGPSLQSFAGMVTIGYFEPIPVMLLVLYSVYVATEPAGDVEAKLVDLLLSRPINRSLLVTRTVLACLIQTAAIVLSMGLAMWAGLWWLAPSGTPWPEPGVVLTLMLYLAAVAWAFGAVAMAVACGVGRRASAIGPVAITAIAMYLLEVLGHSWAPARTVAVVSLFHYFPGAAVLESTAGMATNLAVLGAVSAAAIAASYWQFARRDL